MQKRTFYIHTAKTEYLRANCGKHHLSIASEKFSHSKKVFNDIENHPDISEEMKQFAIDSLTSGSLIFICQNCKAHFFYEVDLILSEDAYRSRCLNAMEKEVQEYME